MNRRALVGSVLLSRLVLAGALPAFAANPSLALTPNYGTATQTFSARVTYSIGHGKCPATASFTWDGVSLGSASFVGTSTCTATKSGLKPPSGHRAAGTHIVRGSFVYKQASHSTSAIFTVTAPKPTPTPTPTKTATPKPTPSPSVSASPSPSSSASPSPSASVSASASARLTASPSTTTSAVSTPGPSTSPGSTLNVPSEAAVHHGNGAFWLILGILAALVIGPGIWFALRGDGAGTRAEDSPPPPPGPEQ